LADLPPRASLGFGFQCTECSYDGEAWSFTEPPEVQGVARGSTAWTAGLRTADRIVAVDGLDVMTPEGGRRFAGIQAGDQVAWTVTRSGERLEIETTVEEQEVRGIWSSRAPAEGPVRFAGTVGETTVEVRGGRVAVTESEDGNLIVIQTGDTVIRIRAGGPGGGSGGN
jgi:membrane-associated protease RseP (regulator of RpoE activity)